MSNNDTPSPTDLQAAHAALHEQHTVLQAEHDQLARVNKQLRLFALLADRALDGIIISDPAGAAFYINPRGLELLGVQNVAECTARMAALLGPELIAEQIAALHTSGRWQGSYWATRADGTRWRVLSSVFPLIDDGQTLAFAAFARDVTEDYKRDQEHITLQEQVIAVQQSLLSDISSPLLPIAAGVVVMPLIGELDTRRVQHIMQTLLEGIVAHQADFAILDITGVKVVDTQAAQALVQVAQAATLLGTRVILTGIAAEVAQSLVALGVDLGGIITRNNLQSGVAFVLAQATL